ncbi:hypothetical protein ACHAXS_013308 [Conticribra weissflogii]
MQLNHGTGFELEEALYSTAPIGLHCVDDRGVILWVNWTELNVLGYSKEEYVGRHVSSFVYSDKPIDQQMNQHHSRQDQHLHQHSDLQHNHHQHDHHPQQQESHESNHPINLITADDKTLYKEILKSIVSGNPIKSLPVRFVTRSGNVVYLLLDCDGTAICTSIGSKSNESSNNNIQQSRYFRCFTRDDTPRRIQEMSSNVLFQETNRSLQKLDNFMNRAMCQMRMPLTLMERACDLVTENIEDIDEVLRRNSGGGGAGCGAVSGLINNSVAASNNPLSVANPASYVAGIGMTGVAPLNQSQLALQQQLQLQLQEEPSRKKPRHNPANTEELDGKPRALPQINNNTNLNSAPTHICQNSNYNEIPNTNLNLSAPLNVALSATSEARSVLNLASAIVQDASGLVDDITDLCRFDQGQVLVIEKEAVKVREICTEALTKVQIPIGSQGLVEVVLDIQEGAPGRTMTDRSVLKRCLALLLNFAVDAAANAVVSRNNAAAGGVEAFIGNGEKGKVILSVSDVALEQQSQTGKSACKISVFYTNPPDSNDVHAHNALGESGHGSYEDGQNAGFDMLRDSYNKGTNNESNGFGSGFNNQQQTQLSHGEGLNNNNLWRNSNHLAASGGSMMRRIHLRESIESGMTSCRRDKLGLGLSLLYHLVGAQGSDLRYEMVASEPTTSSSLSVTHGRSAHITLPSMSNFWFLLPMSLDFPDRLPAERIVKEDCTNQNPNPPVQIPFPRQPSYSSYDANELEVRRTPHNSSKPTEPVSMGHANDNAIIVDANLIGTTIYTHAGTQTFATATATLANTPVEPQTIQVAAAAATTTKEGAAPSTLAAAPAKSYPGVTPGSRPLVLVVEDTDVSASLLCMHLRKLNCTSHRAENGEVALEMLRSAPTPNMYSLILMDLRMPVMDGFEATTIIKGSNASNIPVVALTGETSEENRRKCEEIGFDDYKTKPLKRPQLMELLNKFVPGYQASA